MDAAASFQSSFPSCHERITSLSLYWVIPVVLAVWLIVYMFLSVRRANASNEDLSVHHPAFLQGELNAIEERLGNSRKGSKNWLYLTSRKAQLLKALGRSPDAVNPKEAVTS